ncbi:MAG: hypothetical protein Q9195_005897 [Heterodermia aff. obscurata]
MAALSSAGSPATRSRPTPSNQFQIHEDSDDTQDSPLATRQMKSKHAIKHSEDPLPLASSKLGNTQPQAGNHASTGFKKQKLDSSTSSPATHPEDNDGPMSNLLAKLSEQQSLLKNQSNDLTFTDDDKTDVEKARQEEGSSSLSSELLTPASDSFGDTYSNENSKEDSVEKAEMARLKQQLDDAKDEIARQKQELDQTRIMKHTLHQAIGSSADTQVKPQDMGIGVKNPPISPPGRTSGSHQDHHWDTRSVMSEGTSIDNFNTSQQVWGQPSRPAFHTGLPTPVNQQYQGPTPAWGQPGTRPWGNRGMPNSLPPLVVPQQQQLLQSRTFSGPASPVSNNDYSQFQTGPGLRRSNTQNRAASFYPQARDTNWDVFGGGVGSLDGMNIAMNPSNTYQAIGMYPAPVPYQPRPIGTPLSPEAAEFRTGQASANPWNNAPPSSPEQTYISPMEPLNYRRLLDRSVTCNWKYIVDKIVCNNDQQASIFLQQKLKVGTVEQKYEIIEAIVAQAYPLMVNRFGNFLIQRCFEHGTPEQVIAIANAIRGNTLSLSMDAFGCHVVQKAFDVVPEEYKAIMVHELLRRIPETVIHRYACHVWQKLFELRWSDSPPQIMKFVNEALGGMWHDVALGETGSLVVQNIFENCLEEDKRACINEVLASIDIVAHGQFGNWCIQHICEHGAPQDRSRAIDHVLRYATEYSMDQFASKVVEKCLKIGGADFLERYLERVCEGRSDRPRIPLIDIASDQYGNYLIQYILTHANPTHREIVASHIRKHMVSLRGSKFGSRVGMLCCNPAYATHPGPGVGLAPNRYTSNGQSSTARYGGAYR